MPPKPTTDQIASFFATAPPNIPKAFVEFHRQHGAVSVDLNSEDCGFVFLCLSQMLLVIFLFPGLNAVWNSVERLLRF